MSDKKLHYLCCHDGFVNPNNGTIDNRDFYDYLHFSDVGYEKFCSKLVDFIMKNIMSS